MKHYVIIAVLLSMLPFSCIHADVVLDGTLGPAGALNGPEYHIGAELGRQAGPNLFHSFSTFDIGTGESAIFSGPASVQTIISRVTGGNMSHIDGMIQNTVEGADFYFLNPAGILFGPNASLDMTGSFHASTADDLRLGENDRFTTSLGENDVLSSAAPAAFGFLDWEIGPITINGKGRISEDAFWDESSSSYWVPSYESFSFIGGDIRIQSGTYAEMNGEILPRGTLIIMENGRMDIASVASPGEVVLDETGPDVTRFERLGGISMSENSVIHASGGTVMIRGGSFYMSDSGINVGQVRLSESEVVGLSGGLADILTDNIIMENSAIMAQTYDTGAGGHITLAANQAVRLENSRLSTISNSPDPDAGPAGDIHISAPSLVLDASIVSTSGLGDALPGGILLGTDVLEMTSGASVSADCESRDHLKGIGIGIGRDVTEMLVGQFLPSHRVSMRDGASVSAFSQGSGRAGNIAISTEILEMENAAFIASDGLSDGDAGAILVGQNLTLSNGFSGGVQAADLIRLSNGSYVSTRSAASGDAGMILAFASRIGLESDSFVSSSATSTGQSGNAGIVYMASDQTDLNGDHTRVTTLNKGQGNAGAIILDTSELKMDTNAEISSASLSQSLGGRGGVIVVQATDGIRLANHARITTSSGGTGNAGSIGLITPRLTLENGAHLSSESLSESDGGNAGNILAGGRLVIKRGGQTIDWANKVVAMLTQAFDISEADIASVELPGNAYRLDTGAFVSTSTSGAGNAGFISLAADDIALDGGASIYSVSLSETGGGDAGLIRIGQTDRLTVKNGATITTEAVMAGGGRIMADVDDFFYLQSGQISTSVQFGTGNGGDIDIGNPDYSVLNNGLIVAKAYEGNGGGIRIGAGHFVQSSDSLVSASSALGIDGSVVIESPETDAESGLSVLPATFLDASGWMDTPCAFRKNETTGRFVISGRDALPSVPYDVSPQQLLWVNED